MIAVLITQIIQIKKVRISQNITFSIFTPSFSPPYSALLIFCISMACCLLSLLMRYTCRFLRSFWVKAEMMVMAALTRTEKKERLELLNR